jgi:hypothetical protein
MLIEKSHSINHQAATGAPDWVTPELLASTGKTWQPHYRNRLTDRDSLEILLSVSRLLDVLHDQTAATETDT